VAFPDLAHPLGNLCFGGTVAGHGTGLGSMRRYTAHALVLVLGHGRYRDGLGNDRRLQPGDVVVVVPGRPHMYGPEDGDRWGDTFIVFDGPLADAWRPHGLDHQVPVWHLGPVARWQPRFERIIRRPPRTMAALSVRLGRFQRLLALVLDTRPASERPAWLTSAFQALGQPRVDLARIARRHGYSPDGFRRSFRDAVGITPSAFHRQARLRIAGRLLGRADLTLDDIARAAGFYDGFHLSREWKRAHGRSPRQGG
jgi:AraC-like DNA-binding protein